ncbi:alpha/beta hydrolase family protein [Thalassotalea agarivorans]|uniref:Dipeptidyl aminopeptidase/acylaminoacyl peptidase n=2 Tax=Thalassotalea agarivorans TaxID=349064 RepID=A0A1I0E1R0_THASX|nr:S9 family peptidase [Thalassotalea agarivorans]SET39012.1 Dipeptidyl aminopeptidase/acylaminoacyl peptidase [Thalassotalea agarivorans]
MRIVVAFLCLLSFATSAQQAKTLTAEDYGKLPDISMVTLSPSGDRVAYRQVSKNGDHIVVLDLTTNKLLSAINAAEVKPNYAYFVNENQLVMVVSNTTKLWGYRGRHEISSAWSYNLETNKLFPLLKLGYGIYDGQSGLGRVVGLSADQKYAYMPAWKSAGRYSLFKVNLEKSRKPRPVALGRTDVNDYFVGSSDNIIARERYNNETNIHRVEAYIDESWVEIYKEETDRPYIGISGITPDESALVISTYNDETDRFVYRTMALQNGEVSAPIFSREDKDVDGLVTDLNRKVYGVRYAGFEPTYEFFDEKLNARMRGLKKALAGFTFSIVDYTPDWNSIVLELNGKQAGGDFYLYHKGKLRFLTASRSNIPYDMINEVQSYTYKAADGLEIPSLITLPQNKEAKNLPAIMMPHGGPASHNTKEFHYRAQFFASQGYAVIQPQFRGSDGFGWAHQFAGYGQWGQKMQTDLTDAVNDLANKGTIDPSRVCIVGGSYGGYAALAGATLTPDVYQCAVSVNGVSDLNLMLKQERRDHGSDHWVLSYWQDVMTKTDADEELLAKISPINHVEKVKIPVLLIHGQYDKVVNVQQSEDMYDELKDAKKQVEFIELDKGDHYLSNNDNRVKAMKAMAEFVKKHI